MDWSNVTAEDLIEALGEVDWSSLPRPVSEFFFRFTVPRSVSKWDSRLKCNLYSEKVTRTVRQAAKMRPPFTHVICGRLSAKRSIYICGQPRWVFVSIFSTVSFILCFVSCALFTVLWAFAIGLLATIAHASFRVPNLKARLNTFRAVWQNRSEL